MTLYGGVRYIDEPCPDNIALLDGNCLGMISQMQINGIRLDCPFLHSLTSRITTRQSELESSTRSHIGDYSYHHSKHGRIPFSIGSRDHLSQLLFDHLKIHYDPITNIPDDVPMTESGGRYQVSEDSLAPFKKRHPVVPLVIEWHSIDKIKNTYTTTLPTYADSDSRVHTKFNVTVAATGRLSSSSPNLQNISTRSEIGRQVRRAFIASPGCTLVSNDLSQIEMRIAAHGSMDQKMIEVFRTNKDIHTMTACAVFGRDYDDVMNNWDKESPEFKRWKKEERAPSKNLGFGVLYGLTAEGLQRNILTESEGEINWTQEQCQSFIDQFFTFYPGLRDLMNLQYRRARRHAMVWDMFGRVRLVPEAKSVHKWISNEGERKAGNHYEQASAQGVLKLAMAEIQAFVQQLNKSYTCRSLLQIHDELIHEVDSRIANEFGMVCQQVFENVAPLAVPVLSSGNYADNWMDL